MSTRKNGNKIKQMVFDFVNYLTINWFYNSTGFDTQRITPKAMHLFIDLSVLFYISMAHILTHEPENGEYEQMRNFKTCFKNGAYQGKPPKGRSMWTRPVKRGYNDKRSNQRGSGRKRPLGKPHLRWADCAKRDVKVVDPSASWSQVAEDRERLRNICHIG